MEDITSLLAIIVSFISLAHTILLSRKIRHNEIVTSARIAWMNKIKQDMVDFVSCVYKFLEAGVIFKYEENKAEELILNTKLQIIDLYSTFLIHFNPSDEYNQALLDNMKKIYKHVMEDNIDKNALNKLLKDLISKMQKTATLEWEGIKLEVEKGNISKSEKQKLIKENLKDY
ncbi:MAG: hypothetical protein P1P64_03285 [Treponemataceae bacterium]